MTRLAPPTADELFLYATNNGENYPDLCGSAVRETETTTKRLVRLNARHRQLAMEWVGHANLAARTYGHEFPQDPAPDAGTILDLAHALRTYYIAHILEG